MKTITKEVTTVVVDKFVSENMRILHWGIMQDPAWECPTGHIEGIDGCGRQFTIPVSTDFIKEMQSHPDLRFTMEIKFLDRN